MRRTYRFPQLVMQSYAMRSIRDGVVIPDEVARMIAGVHVGSGEPALTAFEQTGVIDADAMYAELRVRLELLNPPHGQEIGLCAAFVALQCYVILHGQRDAVPGWTDEDAYMIVSRYSERHDPDGGHNEFTWASDSLLTELVARQRADYVPLFVAWLTPGEVDVLHGAVIAYDAHLASNPKPPGIVAAFGGGIILALGEDGDDSYTWDPQSFASMLHSLRWFAGHDHGECNPKCGSDDEQRGRARTLYTEIAESLGVTVTD